MRRARYAEYIIRETMKPIPWAVKPPIMISNARLCRSCELRIPACGPIIRSG